MNEADLTRKMMDACEIEMPFSQVLKHADRFNGAYPDVTVTWHRPTSWWEVKFYNERMFTHQPGQKEKCQQLAEQGICYYVIYELRRGTKTTRIVPPKWIDQWDTWNKSVSGFNHVWVAQQIREVHEMVNVCTSM